MTIGEISGYSIFLALLVGLARIRSIGQPYILIIALFFIASLNELLSYYLMGKHIYTTINNNVYVLIESLLILVFFKKSGLYARHRRIFFYIAGLYLLVWSTENFLFGAITQVGSYFRIVYSFTTALLSISMINKLLDEEKTSLLLHPSFILSCAFILFFTYKLIVEVFWLYGQSSSTSFQIKLYSYVKYINLATNLIFAFALLCIPKRKTYSLL